MRIVCRAANTLRLGTLKLLIKAIVKNIRQSDVCRTGIKYIIRKIVHKYKFLNHRRKRKPSISASNSLIQLQWVPEYSESFIYDRKDIVLPVEYRSDVGNDSRTLGVWIEFSEKKHSQVFNRL